MFSGTTDVLNTISVSVNTSTRYPVQMMFTDLESGTEYVINVTVVVNGVEGPKGAPITGTTLVKGRSNLLVIK